jgi:hypothetical protein
VPNSYSSQLVGGGAQNGAVLSIKLGGTAQLLIGGPASAHCTVCHAVSADGSTLIAAHPTQAAGNNTWSDGTTLAKADLYIAHLASKTTARLDVLDGYRNGALYLPYGADEATCCSGFCRQTTGPDGGSTYTCVPPPQGCAKE